MMKSSNIKRFENKIFISRNKERPETKNEHTKKYWLEQMSAIVIEPFEICFWIFFAHMCPNQHNKANLWLKVLIASFSNGKS